MAQARGGKVTTFQFEISSCEVDDNERPTTLTCKVHLPSSTDRHQAWIEVATPTGVPVGEIEIDHFDGALRIFHWREEEASGGDPFDEDSPTILCAKEKIQALIAPAQEQSQ
jgi:hypothetical protein